MERFSAQHVGIILLVLAVGLAGCGSGDGGVSPTPTETTTETPTDTGDGGATPTQTATDGGETATATATPGDGSTPTPTDTEPTTPTATPTPAGGEDPSVVDTHPQGLRNAGSYTVEITATIVTTAQNGSSMVQTVNVTQKRIVETNEAYSRWGVGPESFEYYKPPNSQTAYLNIQGQTQEVSADRAFLLNYTSLTTGAQTQAGLIAGFSDAGEVTSGSTELGPATLYVIDSPENLPGSVQDAYEQINSVRYRVWVDEDTGIIAKYDYRIEVVQDGEEMTFEGGVEVVDLGTTTIEAPDWAP